MFNAMKNQLANIVREGVVSVTYPERHSCRVTFPDRENLVSAELPVLTCAAFENKAYHLPCVGERVICLMVSNDDTGHSGYIIGSLYTSENLPTVNNQDIFSLKFVDDAEFNYKRATQQDKTSRFYMKMADSTEFSYTNDNNSHEFLIKFGDGCSISYSYGNNAEFEVKFANGDTITHARGALDVDINGEINITARGDINMRGANIHLN